MTEPLDLENYGYFLDEAQDLLRTIEQDLLSLKEDPSPNKVNNMMRSAHTLKGAAAAVGLDTIKEISHVLEDVFKTLYNPDVIVDDEIESLLFQGYECLRLPLTAHVNGSSVDESSMLNRAANVITQLQDKLGDCFDPNAPLPSSTDLGFDVVQSIFETGVEEKLTQIENAAPEEVGTILRQKAEVFLGLGESLDLPGYSAIAKAILTALDGGNEPTVVAQIALADLRTAQKAILAGDRDRGGAPSAKLLQLAEQVTSPTNPAESIEAIIPTVEVVATTPPPEELVTDAASEIVTEETSEVTVKNIDDEADTVIQLDSEGDRVQPVIGLSQLMENTEIDPSEVAAVSPSPAESDIHPGVSLDLLFADTTLDTEPPAAETRSSELVALDSPQTDSDSASSSNDEPLSLERLLDRATVDEPVTESDNSSIQTIPPSSDRTSTTNPTPNTDRKSESAPSQKDRKSASVRVEIEQLERLNHLAGELLINQNQQTNQDKQLRTVVQELLEQLHQHQQTLNELRDWSDRKWLDRQNLDRCDLYNPASALNSMFDPLEMDRYNDLQVLIQKAADETIELENHAEQIYQSGKQASRSRETQQRLLTHVRDDLTTARMQPLGDLFNRFPRLLKQLAAVHKKQAQLILSGNDVLVDKAIVEKLYDPLLHLIRNAFDRGIDAPEVRREHNKPVVGTIEIRAYHLGNRTIIEIKDDGRGINFAKIAQKAVESGFITAERKHNIPESELLEFLFKSGFSTANELTELSGRGVGLDVVRSQLEALNGSITINSVPNRGTTFTLEIPLSLTITKLLVCQTNNVAYAIPVNTVEQILIPSADRFRIVGNNVNNLEANQTEEYLGSQNVSQQLVLHYLQNNKETLVPIYKLSELTKYSALSSRFLQRNANAELMETEGLLSHHSPVVLLRSTEGLIGLQIEQLLGEKELVIRTLGTVTNPPSYIYGCCILSNTSLALVIDGEKLIQHQQKASSTIYPRLQGNNKAPLLLPTTTKTSEAIEIEADRLTKGRGNLLLVVDDSLTLRKTLAKALQKFGFEVIQAENGKDGLEKLHQNSEIDLVICDIEMPHLNGLEFLKVVNQEHKTQKTPVVMLTSRSTGKYRKIASELGASAYLTKPFLEKELYSTIDGILSSRVV